MTEVRSMEQRQEAEKGILSDLSKKQRGLTEKLRALELVQRKLTAQVAMQGLFVDVGTVVEAAGGRTGQDLEAEYDGRPANVDIVHHSENMTEIVVTDRDGDNLFADLKLTRDKNSKDWNAILSTTKDGRNWRRFGRKGERDYPASGLFEGSKERDTFEEYNRNPDGFRTLLPDGIENGLHPDVVRVAAILRSLVARPPASS